MRLAFLAYYPNIIKQYLEVGCLFRTIKASYVNLEFFSYCGEKYFHVDDYIYGGGKGLLLRCDSFERSLPFDWRRRTLINLSPKGKKLNVGLVHELMKHEDILFISSRYEGMDSRIPRYYNCIDVSVADAVFFGGEIGAMMLSELIVRYKYFDAEAVENDTFRRGSDYIEHDQYTRPRVWRGLEVPDILLSGHHKKISKWKNRL